MILVTGGLGMIGEHTALALVDSGHEVVVIAHHRTHDTGFAPAFDIAAAVADYVAWRAGNPR